MEKELPEIIEDICRCLTDGCWDCEYLDREDGGRCFEIVLTEALEALNRQDKELTERIRKERMENDQRVASGLDRPRGDVCRVNAGGAGIGEQREKGRVRNDQGKRTQRRHHRDRGRLQR